MRPEESVNCIRIGQALVPAQNIQIDDKRGIYFEILFKNATLWAVEQYFSGENSLKVMVTEYPRWGLTETLDYPGVTLVLQDWVEFLGLYDEKKIVSGC